MSTTLDKLQEQATAAAGFATEEYRELVRKLAAGVEDPELGEVQEILTAHSKSVSDLKRDVWHRQQRNELQAQIKAAQAAAKERPAIEAQIAEANRELQIAKDRHLQATRPLRQQLQQIETDLISTEWQKRELRDGCDSEDLKDLLAGNKSQTEVIQLQCREIEQHIHRLKQIIRTDERAGLRSSRKERLKALEADLAERREQLGELAVEQRSLVEEFIWS